MHGLSTQHCVQQTKLLRTYVDTDYGLRTRVIDYNTNCAMQDVRDRSSSASDILVAGAEQSQQIVRSNLNSNLVCGSRISLHTDTRPLQLQIPMPVVDRVAVWQVDYRSR